MSSILAEPRSITDAREANTNPSSDFFYIKLVKGDYGLATTYWLFGVIGNAFFALLSAWLYRMLPLDFLSLYYLLVTFGYTMPYTIGLTNATLNYDGNAFFALLGWIMTAISWVITTASVIVLFSLIP